MSELSEFSPQAAAMPPPVQASTPPPVKPQASQHWLKRPLVLGQSIPWLALYASLLLAMVWYLYAPKGTQNVNGLAFGEPQALQPEPAPSAPSFAPATPDAHLAQLQDQVAAMVAGVRSHSEANREAIDRLAVTVKTLMDGQAVFKQQLNELQAQLALASAQRTVSQVKQLTQAKEVAHRATGRPRQSTRTPEHTPTPLAGMHRVAVQNGMAWVFYQDKTWAVQVGDTLGPVTITGIDAKAQQVRTSAGLLE